ncbi:MAG: hypothetical protein US53_C0068G0011 [Candidatus Woesebacteria bacterium GW2011_GWA1_37_7]|uniref:Uncharacterized protein n=1 Tax=Candidatus Woesebacteria bacterium GW2011_GWA1_37_7 TaxID=1618545 RepID=A0A0G0HBK9_9BACT|nr:MAG: hypothetical protein US53_C0068G0011 [Candidatus Woesebacteria bacterium GW2011_GWA1_37_7]
MNNKIAQVIGQTKLPSILPDIFEDFGTGFPLLIGNFAKLLVIVAGVYAIINFIIAGYTFLSAQGDPKKIADAWNKIWQSMLGVIVAAGAYVLAAIISYLVYGVFDRLLEFRIPGPTS